MKLKLIAAALGVFVLTGNAMAATDTATVSITGTVTGSACTIEAPPSLTLETVSADDMMTGGASYLSAHGAPLSVTLKNCSAGSLVDVMVLGNQDSSDSSLLANASGVQYAQKVGIGFYNKADNTVIDINTGHSIAQTNVSGEDMVFDLIVAPRASVQGQLPTAGDIDAQAQLKVNFL